jgi:hypothetical protein
VQRLDSGPGWPRREGRRRLPQSVRQADSRSEGHRHAHEERAVAIRRFVRESDHGRSDLRHFGGHRPRGRTTDRAGTRPRRGKPFPHRERRMGVRA